MILLFLTISTKVLYIRVAVVCPKFLAGGTDKFKMPMKGGGGEKQLAPNRFQTLMYIQKVDQISLFAAFMWHSLLVLHFFLAADIYHCN